MSGPTITKWEYEHPIDGLIGEKIQHERTKEEVKRLRDWLEPETVCPCCEYTHTCSEGCTFEIDCPEEWERMAAVREVLYGSGTPEEAD